MNDILEKMKAVARHDERINELNQQLQQEKTAFIQSIHKIAKKKGVEMGPGKTFLLKVGDKYFTMAIGYNSQYAVHMFDRVFEID